MDVPRKAEKVGEGLVRRCVAEETGRELRAGGYWQLIPEV